MNQPVSIRSLLLFQVGPVPCCLDSAEVEMVIVPPEHITALPGNSAGKPGIFEHGGRTVALIDLRSKFGLPTDEPGRVVITRVDQQYIGFLVDRINKITEDREGKWKILPAEIPRNLFDAVFEQHSVLNFHSTARALSTANVCTRTQHFINRLVKNENQSSDGSEASISKKSSTQVSSSAGKNTKQKAASTHQQVNRDKQIQTDEIITPVAKPRIQSRSIAPEVKPAGAKLHSPVPPFESKNNNPQVTRDKQQNINRNKPAKSVEHRRMQTPVKPVVASTQPPPVPPVKKPEVAQQDSSELLSQNSNNQVNAESQQFNGLLVILFLLIMTLVIMTLAGYYLYPFFQPENITLQNRQTTNRSQHQLPSPVEQPERLDTKDKIEPVSETVTNSNMNNNEIQTETTAAQLQKNDADQKDVTTISDDISITHQDDLITITIESDELELEEPGDIETRASTEVINEDNKKEIQTRPEPRFINSDSDDSSQDNVVSSKTENSTTQALSNQSGSSTPQPRIMQEIIHVVVKGDTLWHIAKKYLKNPFKYPQLAQASNINNPDLIYPGNKVRIIIIQNSK